MSVALLLEDEPPIAMDIEIALENLGYDVTTVASCSDAHVWLDNNCPDVAIVDIQLRDGSSDSVAARQLSAICQRERTFRGFRSE